jgi:hypothetical protein
MEMRAVGNSRTSYIADDLSDRYLALSIRMHVHNPEVEALEVCIASSHAVGMRYLHHVPVPATVANMSDRAACCRAHRRTRGRRDV